MKIETKNLRTFGNYAKEKNVERQTVYLWEKLKKVKSINIDGVKFVVVK